MYKKDIAMESIDGIHWHWSFGTDLYWIRPSNRAINHHVNQRLISLFVLILHMWHMSEKLFSRFAWSWSLGLSAYLPAYRQKP